MGSLKVEALDVAGVIVGKIRRQMTSDADADRVDGFERTEPLRPMPKSEIGSCNRVPGSVPALDAIGRKRIGEPFGNVCSVDIVSGHSDLPSLPELHELFRAAPVDQGDRGGWRRSARTTASGIRRAGGATAMLPKIQRTRRSLRTV